MGAWGVAVFSDDNACDVRDDFRELIGAGYSATDATDLLVARCEVFSGGDEDEEVAWIALAVVQSRSGRLLTSVRERALAAMESGKDLERWTEVGLREKRLAVFGRVRDELLGPQRPPTRVPKVGLLSTPFSKGDVLVYRASSGEHFALRVLRNESEQHLTGTSASSFVQVAAVGRPNLPPIEVLQNLYAPLFGSGTYRTTIQVGLQSSDRYESRGWSVLGNYERPDDPEDGSRGGRYSGFVNVQARRTSRAHIDTHLPRWLDWYVDLDYSRPQGRERSWRF